MIPALRQYLPHCTKRVGVSVISMSTWAVFVLGPYVYVRVCSRPYEKDLVPHPAFVGNQVNIITSRLFSLGSKRSITKRDGAGVISTPT